LRKLALLWSLGKDSNVMIWLARKAFFGHVPFPASVNTKGIVTNGDNVGQAPEMDCASVSTGERVPPLKP